MLDKLQTTGSNGYFTQAVADYAAKMKPKDGQNGGGPKTIGEFSDIMRFMKVDSMGTETSKLPEKPDIKDTIDDVVADVVIQKLLGKGKQAPYSLMADERGIVEYKGVELQCDYERNRICLGDVSDSKKCISVSLEKGGCLVFNRENIDDLVKAIGMFSPEDINRIMRAIAEDAKVRQTLAQIEDETSGVEVLDKPEEEEEYESKRQDEQSDF